MPQWTCKKLADAVASELQLQSGQSYETDVIIPRLNLCYEEIWYWNEWAGLSTIDSITVKSGSQNIVLPKKYGRLIYNLPPKQVNDLNSYENLQVQLVSVLRMGKTRWIQEFDPHWKTVSLGDSPVLIQPAASDTPNVVSSSTDDTTSGLKVRLEGYSAGEVAGCSVQLNGTTPVAASLAFDAGQYSPSLPTPSTSPTGGFIGISKSGTSAGTISVTSSSGAVTYATLASYELDAKYAVYQINEIASADTSVWAIVHRRFIPFFHYMSVPFMDKIAAPLIHGTVDLCLSEMRQQDYAGSYRSRMVQRLGDIIAENQEPMEGPILRA